MTSHVIARRCALAIEDINTSLHSEPRLSHHRLATVLGYSDQVKLRELIARNADEFRRYGEVVVAASKNNDPKGRGRPGQTYWLNEGQCVLATALSDAPNAPDGRFQIISVFLAYRNGQFIQNPSHTISPAQQRAIQEAVAAGLTSRANQGILINGASNLLNARKRPSLIGALFTSAFCLPAREGGGSRGSVTTRPDVDRFETPAVLRAFEASGSARLTPSTGG